MAINSFDVRDLGFVHKSPSRKATANFTRGAYWQDVSAHGAKIAKSVSPKAWENGENAAGGFFQQTRIRNSLIVGAQMSEGSELLPEFLYDLPFFSYGNEDTLR